ncbi:MAG: precorrin-6Y C5,15-methyltransferase (decarboxylating) subunit CbiT, partial [Candidatus Accumulibacter sp.]|nr:precorrin-6Y C5,15-methyltransferase (decarboxylating) subunit CbiT [Accumulibacter sp.]
AVLATGDPLCHGIAPLLIARLGAAKIEVLPAPSTVQLLCARFRKPWQTLRIASCHGADAGEWLPASASPAHGLYRVLRAIALQPLVAVFTGAQNTPARLARALLAVGHGDDLKLSLACRLQLPDEQLFPDLTLAEVAGREFPEPNVLLLERTRAIRPAALGREDVEYRQRAPEKGLITKQEARVLSLAKLHLAADSVVWDIGAGSGAVGLEAAALVPLGHVWAIEKNAGDASNARANAVRFQASNYTLVEGRAPAHLDGWPDPDAVFIGGSGGELAELIERILGRLKPGGRLVMNFVTLENLATATRALAAAGVPWDLVQLQASRSQPILDMHRLAAQNPVWILTARKEEQ